MIKAKADTGARTSALHAYDIEVQGDIVYFKVHPVQDDTKKVVHCSATLIDQRFVRSSAGRETLRPVIETDIEVSGRRWSIELTLAPRDLMGFRMLIGRQALKGRVLVDPGKSFLGTDPNG
jgi:hypothetical protein